MPQAFEAGSGLAPVGGGRGGKGAGGRVALALADDTGRAAIARMIGPYLAALPGGQADAAYPWLDAYWQEPDDRFPYVVLSGGDIAGFVLVRRLSPAEAAFEIAEFTIAPPYRRRGIGLGGAVAALHRHPGTWKISVHLQNSGAPAFWHRVLEASCARDWRQVRDGDWLHHSAVIRARP